MTLLGIEPTTELMYSLGTIGMAIGVIVAVRGLAGSTERVVTGRESRLVYGLMTWTCGVAAASYFGMYLGFGAFTVDGHYIETLRYVDWALTTPALVAVIGILAGANRRVIVAAAVADFLMIAVGYGASVASGALKWAGFVVSTVFFIVLAYYLFVPFARVSTDEPFEKRALFEKVRNLTGVLWFVYPAVWIFGPSALDVMGVTATAAVVTYLDVTAKTGYTLILASSQGMFDGVLSRSTDDATQLLSEADD